MSAFALAAIRPGVQWTNKHTREATTITRLTSRVERIPDPAGGFRDEQQFVVHHTANVPPGFREGYGDSALSFVEHWEPSA